MRNDDREIWLQQGTESHELYRLFSEYRDLGPDRSLRALYRVYCARLAANGNNSTRPRRLPSHWRRWFKEWKWEERARAFDKYEADATVEREATNVRLRIKKEQAKEWEESSFERLRVLSSKTRKLLEGPLCKSRVVRKVGNEVTITERDRLREYQVLRAEEEQLVSRFFGDLLEPQQSDERSAPLIREFRWVPDPALGPDPDFLSEEVLG